MKAINDYIKESASLFDIGNGGNGGPSPWNYIEYNEGDKRFGDLVAGDSIYFIDLLEDIEIEQLTVTGKITKRNNVFRLPVKPSKYMKDNYLELGPTNGGALFGGGKEYNPNTINDGSVCVGVHNGCAFGTNRDIVLRIARSQIWVKIEDIQDNIETLKNNMADLESKLKSLI